MPPVLEHEVAAEAILWAAEHAGRRELMVGWPTTRALLADKLAPALLDRYLASTGYSAQQSAEPVEPDRGNNLWMPLEGDRGARGRFGGEALDRSRQLWITTHRRALAAGLLAAGALGLLARRM